MTEMQPWMAMLFQPGHQSLTGPLHLAWQGLHGRDSLLKTPETRAMYRIFTGAVLPAQGRFSSYAGTGAINGQPYFFQRTHPHDKISKKSAKM